MNRVANAFDKLFEANMSIESQYNNALEFLGLDRSESWGGIIRFNMSVNEYDKLKEIAPDFIDENQYQNLSPTIGELVKFCRENDFYLESYIVEPSRDDYRISVEGIFKENSEEAFRALKDYIYTLKNNMPDEYPEEYNPEEEYVRAWWD